MDKVTDIIPTDVQDICVYATLTDWLTYSFLTYVDQFTDSEIYLFEFSRKLQNIWEVYLV